MILRREVVASSVHPAPSARGTVGSPGHELVRTRSRRGVRGSTRRPRTAGAIPRGPGGTSAGRRAGHRRARGARSRRRPAEHPPPSTPSGRPAGGGCAGRARCRPSPRAARRRRVTTTAMSVARWGRASCPSGRPACPAMSNPAATKPRLLSEFAGCLSRQSRSASQKPPPRSTSGPSHPCAAPTRSRASVTVATTALRASGTSERCGDPAMR